MATDSTMRRQRDTRPEENRIPFSRQSNPSASITLSYIPERETTDADSLDVCQRETTRARGHQWRFQTHLNQIIRCIVNLARWVSTMEHGWIGGRGWQRESRWKKNGRKWAATGLNSWRPCFSFPVVVECLTAWGTWDSEALLRLICPWEAERRPALPSAVNCELWSDRKYCFNEFTDRRQFGHKLWFQWMNALRCFAFFVYSYLCFICILVPLPYHGCILVALLYLNCLIVLFVVVGIRVTEKANFHLMHLL